jgi:hypothetical protein
VTDQAAKKYAEQLGDEALARQRSERGERHSCCGERIDDGHHMMCSKRPDDEPAAHVVGQETLL